MFNIWHDAALMESVSRFLMRIALFLLLIAGGAWLLQRPYFAINQFRFVGDVGQLNEVQLKSLIGKHLSDGLAGGFFSMELHEVQESLSEISWIKNSSIKRVWPHEIEVNIQAHQPIATWGERYLSADGHLFDAQVPLEAQQKMLVSGGPDEAAELVAKQIPTAVAWFGLAGWQVKKIQLSERYSWRVLLSNGLEVELGRADTPTALEERAARLVNSAQFIQDNLGDAGGYVDLRYPNGFAIRTDKLRRTGTATSMVKIGE